MINKADLFYSLFLIVKENTVERKDEKGNVVGFTINLERKEMVKMIDIIRQGQQIETDFYLDTILSFGKYIGQNVRDILKHDCGYVRWMIDNIKGRTFADEVIEMLNTEELIKKEEMEKNLTGLWNIE
jgi:hypothetical protein